MEPIDLIEVSKLLKEIFDEEANFPYPVKEIEKPDHRMEKYFAFKIDDIKHVTNKVKLEGYAGRAKQAIREVITAMIKREGFEIEAIQTEVIKLELVRPYNMFADALKGLYEVRLQLKKESL